ncbi:hypothetical protein [Dehalogenimonas etheniformans]|nr:hypothetical protein [Dehalogenimonas etheniformans]
MAELHNTPDKTVKDFVNHLSLRWNVIYRYQGAAKAQKMPIE